MNKYLAKGVATALLITTVAGGMALAPINQDAEAATIYTRTKKICAHTKITTQVKPITLKNKVSGKGYIKIDSSKGKNFHKHTESYGYTGEKMKNKSWKYTAYSEAVYTTNVYNAKTRKSTVTYAEAWANGNNAKYTSGYYRKINNSKYSQGTSNNSFYSCPDCKITKKNAVSNYTVKCPYCTKKVTINYKTGIIS